MANAQPRQWQRPISPVEIPEVVSDGKYAEAIAQSSTALHRTGNDSTARSQDGTENGNGNGNGNAENGHATATAKKK